MEAPQTTPNTISPEATIQVVESNNESMVSLEKTIADTLNVCKKIIRTFIHLILKPSRIVRILTSEEKFFHTQYINAFTLIIFTIFLSAGFIKVLVYEALTGLSVKSLELYDSYLKDYTVFSNIIYVVLLVLSLRLLVRILLIIPYFILNIYKVIKPPVGENRSMVFRTPLKMITNFSTFENLNKPKLIIYYYASLWLILMVFVDIAVRLTIFENPSRWVFWVIEIVLCILPSKQLFIYFKQQGFIYKKNAWLNLSFYLILAFTIIHNTTPTSRMVIRNLLILTGHSDFKSSPEPFGTNFSDSITINMNKTESGQCKLDAEICIIGQTDVETCFDRKTLLRMFKTFPDNKGIVFADSSYTNNPDSGILKLAPGEMQCLKIYAYIDTSLRESLKKKIKTESESGVFIKLLPVPEDKSIEGYFKKIKIGLVFK